MRKYAVFRKNPCLLIAAVVESDDGMAMADPHGSFCALNHGLPLSDLLQIISKLTTCCMAHK